MEEDESLTLILVILGVVASSKSKQYAGTSSSLGVEKSKSSRGLNVDPMPRDCEQSIHSGVEVAHQANLTGHSTRIDHLVNEARDCGEHESALVPERVDEKELSIRISATLVFT